MKIKQVDECGIITVDVDRIEVGHLCDASTDREYQRIVKSLSKVDLQRLQSEAEELTKSNVSYGGIARDLKKKLRVLNTKT